MISLPPDRATNVLNTGGIAGSSRRLVAIVIGGLQPAAYSLLTVPSIGHRAQEMASLNSVSAEPLWLNSSEKYKATVMPDMG
jgi:hypothetical protein